MKREIVWFGYEVSSQKIHILGNPYKTGWSILKSLGQGEVGPTRGNVTLGWSPRSIFSLALPCCTLSASLLPCQLKLYPVPSLLPRTVPKYISPFDVPVSFVWVTGLKSIQHMKYMGMHGDTLWKDQDIVVPGRITTALHPYSTWSFGGQHALWPPLPDRAQQKASAQCQAHSRMRILPGMAGQNLHSYTPAHYELCFNTSRKTEIFQQFRPSYQEQVAERTLTGPGSHSILPA